ncbi:hypothetical protein Ancab_024069 [Ancistrocladus abbreviatus]
MPQSFNSVAEALTTFMRILSKAKESLKKIFIKGEYDEYPDDKEMHCSAHLAEMLNRGEDTNDGLYNGKKQNNSGRDKSNNRPWMIEILLFQHCTVPVPWSMIVFVQFLTEGQVIEVGIR